MIYLTIAHNIQVRQCSRIEETTDSQGRKTRVVYNAGGDPLKVTDAAGNSEYYTYDAAGNILTIVTMPVCGCVTPMTVSAIRYP